MSAVMQQEPLPQSLLNHPQDTRMGFLFEEDFFGVKSYDFHKINMPPINDLKIKSLRPYCSPKFQAKMYGFDPENPQTTFGRFLFERVKQSLVDADKGKLRMYCLLGSPADRLGADCSMQLIGENKQALVDLTVNSAKRSSNEVLVLHLNALALAYLKKDSQYLDRFVQKVIDKLHPRRHEG